MVDRELQFPFQLEPIVEDMTTTTSALLQPVYFLPIYFKCILLLTIFVRGPLKYF